MKKLSSNEIRTMWLEFFKSKGHKVYDSAPLVPINDDSLLWINAGVTPLKKYFDGTVVPDEKRITSIQKCIRTNDIENVGITKRHQTFFEMMGNFSIGDYFKDEAIEFAFECLTSSKWFDVPKEKLYVTVYPDDVDTYNKWVEIGFIEDHVVKLEENFWEIGEGPCGPDSEIFYDRGEKYDKDGTALEKFKNDEEQERYVEIWNNVFSQYNSKEGVERKNYKELPHKNIDTGAGLERWCCIFQDVDSNFETDLFTPIIKHIEELTGILYNSQKEFKIIADHIRAITFALSDGASFENVGRGYVLRRLLRRSVRMGKNLNLKEPFLYKLVSDVIDIMGEFYPNLIETRPVIVALILEEEKLFFKTLDAGERRLKDLMENSPNKFITGDEAFKLYDTYGFPFELTLEYLEEAGFSTSKEEFDKCMDYQKELAKKGAKTKTAMASQKKVLLDFNKESKFVYGIYRIKSNVIGIFSKDNLEKKLDHDGYIALKRTCFYAESGGQVSDTGMIVGKNFKARVVDVFKAPNGQHIHKVKLLDGVISLNDDCEIIVDKERRKRIEANHSSVHLLQYALQQVISKTIKQAGSYVDNERFRFDFTYSGKINDDMVVNVENYVKEEIAKGHIVSTEIMPIDKAKELGAMALFSEKYGDMVRVVKIGKSIELCGGTHVNNTKDISSFAIYDIESKGSNTFRIEGCTGDKVKQTLYDVIKPYNDELIKLLLKAKEIVSKAKKEKIELDFNVDIDNSSPESYKDLVYDRNELIYVQKEVKDLEKKYSELRAKQTLSNIDIYTNNIEEINGIKVLLMQTLNEDTSVLKNVADVLTNKGNSLVFFANIKNDSVNFICKSACNLDAASIVKEASVMSLGNGGGSKTFAQGSGKTTDKIDEVFSTIRSRIENE